MVDFIQDGIVSLETTQKERGSCCPRRVVDIADMVGL